MSAETEMKATRIEVPLELAAPHFDDEATVATARQVVPIERARTIELWRKVRTFLPILLAAMLCGGLGAAAMNYYERRQATPAASQPAPVWSSQPPVTESSPMAVAASSDATAGMNASETAAGKAQRFSVQDEREAGDKHAENAAEGIDTSAAGPPKIKRTNPDADTTKLTRKRRVHPDEAAPTTKSNGAGRIVDIFAGPNPL